MTLRKDRLGWRYTRRGLVRRGPVCRWREWRGGVSPAWPPTAAFRRWRLRQQERAS